MSFSIPHQIEQDIIAGRAVYRTFQTGNGGQSILQVPTNSYAVIYGYDFSPAGGGLFKMDDVGLSGATVMSGTIAAFETQQIAFYTGQDFFPFIHHIDVEISWAPRTINAATPDNNEVTTYRTIASVKSSPISRQVYITALNDMTITHGLVINAIRATANAIPITNRTPQALSYGGSPQVMNVQTNYGPNATPLQFMQPSPKDFADFAFGLLPANADNQAFATPDVTNGLVDSTEFITTNIGNAFRDIAASNYFLCLHYALYSKTIPEQRG